MRGRKNQEKRGSDNNEEHNGRQSEGRRRRLFTGKCVRKNLFLELWIEKSIYVRCKTISTDSQTHPRLCVPLNLLKEPSAVLQVPLSPELLENVDGAQ